MRRTSIYRFILVSQLLCLCLVSVQAQTDGLKRIAVTIDDLPLNGPAVDIGRLRIMTNKFLAGIRKYHIPVVGFVNESLLYVPGETDARIAILKQWAESAELGNHTFSHLGFQNASLAQYEDDFLRGDSVTAMLTKQKAQPVRYFRHPFLQMGATQELEKTFENFIAQRGYRIAPVSIDTLDWMILAAYSKPQKQHDKEMMRRVSDEYLKFVDLKLEYCEKYSVTLFGRQIDHILLLHANELNADNFDGLIEVFRKRGYEFVTLEQALKDPVYRFPDSYSPTSDVLANWSLSKGKTYSPPVPPDFIRKIYEEKQN